MGESRGTTNDWLTTPWGRLVVVAGMLGGGVGGISWTTQDTSDRIHMAEAVRQHEEIKEWTALRFELRDQRLQNLQAEIKRVDASHPPVSLVERIHKLELGQKEISKRATSLEFENARRGGGAGSPSRN